MIAHTYETASFTSLLLGGGVMSRVEYPRILPFITWNIYLKTRALSGPIRSLTGFYYSPALYWFSYVSLSQYLENA